MSHKIQVKVGETGMMSQVMIDDSPIRCRALNLRMVAGERTLIKLEVWVPPASSNEPNLELEEILGFLLSVKEFEEYIKLKEASEKRKEMNAHYI